MSVISHLARLTPAEGHELARLLEKSRPTFLGKPHEHDERDCAACRLILQLRLHGIEAVSEMSR